MPGDATGDASDPPDEYENGSTVISGLCEPIAPSVPSRIGREDDVEAALEESPRLPELAKAACDSSARAARDLRLRLGTKTRSS